jgi:hypothetical protein
MVWSLSLASGAGSDEQGQMEPSGVGSRLPRKLQIGAVVGTDKAGFHPHHPPSSQAPFGARVEITFEVPSEASSVARELS